MNFGVWRRFTRKSRGKDGVANVGKKNFDDDPRDQGFSQPPKDALSA